MVFKCTILQHWVIVQFNIFWKNIELCRDLSSIVVFMVFHIKIFSNRSDRFENNWPSTPATPFQMNNPKLAWVLEQSTWRNFKKPTWSTLWCHEGLLHNSSWCSLSGQSHMTNEIRAKLHWLDVPSQVHFKLCFLAYRCIDHSALLSCWIFYSIGGLISVSEQEPDDQYPKFLDTIIDSRTQTAELTAHAISRAWAAESRKSRIRESSITTRALTVYKPLGHRICCFLYTSTHAYELT